MNAKQIAEWLREQAAYIESLHHLDISPEDVAANYRQAADLLERIAWVDVHDRLPVFDETLRVEIYTDGVDFSGEQLFDVRAIDLYDEHPSEVCAAATHWRYLDPPSE